jgi:hypothetical protein
VGLQPDEIGPDHTAKCRFRARLGPDKFQAIFNRIGAQAREAARATLRASTVTKEHLATDACKPTASAPVS